MIIDPLGIGACFALFWLVLAWSDMISYYLSMIIMMVMTMTIMIMIMMMITIFMIIIMRRTTPTGPQGRRGEPSPRRGSA